MKQFTEPEMEILHVELQDIVTTSIVEVLSDENEFIGWWN